MIQILAVLWEKTSHIAAVLHMILFILFFISSMSFFSLCTQHNRHTKKDKYHTCTLNHRIRNKNLNTIIWHHGNFWTYMYSSGILATIQEYFNHMRMLPIMYCVQYICCLWFAFYYYYYSFHTSYRYIVLWFPKLIVSAIKNKCVDLILSIKYL